MLRSSRSFRLPAAFLSAIVAVPVASVAAQSNLAVSPFVSFLPSAGTSPLAGLALMLGGSGGFALRGSANLALETSNTGIGGQAGVRPWGADADAMFLLSGLGGRGSRSITPFAFLGIGTQTTNDAGFSETTHNWSYGAGAAIPIASSVDLFGEGRWRMSQYVLPTSHFAPTPTTELRFGVSFHVGSNGSESSRPRGRRLEVRGE